MSMTAALIQDSLNYYLTAGAVQPRPAAWSVALYNAAQQEIADSGYSRQAATFAVNPPSGLDTAASATNTALLSFGTAVGTYTVSYVGVFADATLIVMQRLVTDMVLAPGDPAQMAQGELTIGGRI